MNIFFTCKNTLVITLQFYRLMVVQLEKREALAKEAKMLEKKKAAANSKRQTSSRTSSSKRHRRNEVVTERSTTRRKNNRSSSGMHYVQLYTVWK